MAVRLTRPGSGVVLEVADEHVDQWRAAGYHDASNEPDPEPTAVTDVPVRSSTTRKAAAKKSTARKSAAKSANK